MPSFPCATRGRVARRLAHAARLAILATLAALALPSTALADAELVSTNPADGATVEGSPAAVVATFDEPLGPNSSIELFRDGTSLATGGVDPDDPTSVRIPAPALDAGSYEARVAAFSADGHLVRSTFTFTVIAAPTPTPPPPATRSPDASPSPDAATPSPTPAPSPAGGSDAEPSAADVVVPIVAALALLAVLGGWLIRRRGRPVR